MIDKLFPHISPRLGLEMLTKFMPERIGHSVDKYEIHLFAKTNRVDFLIHLPDSFVAKTPEDATILNKYLNPETMQRRPHLYNLDDSKKICAIIKKLIEAKLSQGYTLDAAIIKYDKNNPDIICESYGVKDNEKIKQEFKF